MQGLLDLIYPRTCYLCEGDLTKTNNRFFCLKCWKSIELIRCGICKKCGYPRGTKDHSQSCLQCLKKTLYFKEARMAGTYQPILRSLMHRYKFHKEIALRFPLSAIMLWQMQRVPFPKKVDVVVPVPISHQTMCHRSYNQAGLLAQCIAAKWKIPMQACLRKMRATLPQVGLTRKEREQNLHQVFAIPEGIFQSKRVLLVDDIVTTGSTATECSRLLRNVAKAKSVYVVAAARCTVE